MKKNERELLWQLFMDTGDPLCWMLARRWDADRNPLRPGGPSGPR